MESKNYFFDAKHLEVNQEGRGVKVHPLVALALAAMVSGLFVVFMPAVGLYMAAKYLVVKPIVNLLASFKHAVIAPVAAPGFSYLDGTGEKGSPAAESTLKNIQDEIDSKRSE